MSPLFAEIAAVLDKAAAEADRAKRAALRSELDNLRAFRHRVRNLYGSELVAAVVKEKAARAPAVVAKVRRALRVFESAVTRSPGRRKPAKRS